MVVTPFHEREHFRTGRLASLLYSRFLIFKTGQMNSRAYRLFRCLCTLPVHPLCSLPFTTKGDGSTQGELNLTYGTQCFETAANPYLMFDLLRGHSFSFTKTFQLAFKWFQEGDTTQFFFLRGLLGLFAQCFYLNTTSYILSKLELNFLNFNFFNFKWEKDPIWIIQSERCYKTLCAHGLTVFWE